VLEQGEVYPVGSTQAKPLNIRLLAATHQDLTKKVQEGSFRHDLFFRLNVFEIHLPALRDRLEDLPLLIDHFLRRLSVAGSVPPETLEFLRRQPWPGNVRELRNALEHAVIVAQGGNLLPEHFPEPASAPLAGADRPDQALAEWVRRHIGQNPGALYQETIRMTETALFAEVLKHVGGNQVQAARLLGLSRTTLRKKLAEYGFAQPDLPENSAEGP
jgi:two-component system, NtrC family, nitrogen regulation response regulator GlnG